jgi:hypothetical protein
MKISSAFPSKYLKADDLQGRTVTVIIKTVVMEDFDDGEKPILYFSGKDKGMALNKTNATTLAQAFGDDTDGWRGGEVELYAIDTEYQGKPTKGLRVRIKPVRRDMEDDRAPAPVITSGRQEPVRQSRSEMDEDIPFNPEMRG